MPVSSRGPPQVIDTVPMDETTEEMFRYFEPLYEVIHDMPRPPESFFKSKGGEWGLLCPVHPCPGRCPPGTALPLSPVSSGTGTGTASGSRSSPGHVLLLLPEGARDGHTASPRPCRGTAAAEGLFGHTGVPLCDTGVPLSDTVWAFSPQNSEVRI